MWDIAIIGAEGFMHAYRNIFSPECLDRFSDSASIDKRARNFAADLGAKADVIPVATDGGKVVGYAQGGAVKSDEFKTDAELSGLYLNPDYIGRGIGKKLFQSFAEYMKNRGAKTLGLACFSENESGMRYGRENNSRRPGR